ncbi:MAG: group II intron reverse transcriptase/maturase, partial [Patescibacteria group bacterium]
MYEKITQEATLLRAFHAVRRNKGCPGIDKQSIQQFGQHLGMHIRELARLTSQRRYKPLPAARVYIPKPNGKQRPLGIPAVRDRIVQQAVRETIEPLLERTFKDASYGFRPARNAHQAIAQIREYIHQGYVHVVDADIRDFFGTLDHQILMAKVRNAIPDRDSTRLIWQFLKAGVLEDGAFRTTTAGTPQGGVISPLLANLYLTEFDECMERAGLKLVRYADDFVILCKSVNQVVYAMRTAREKLGKLKLTLAEEKTTITEVSSGFTFLGYTFWKRKETLYTFPSDKAIRAYKDKVRHASRRQQPQNITMVIERLNPIVRGWGNYFNHWHGTARLRRLDEWTRMRLRSFLLKKRRVSLEAHTKYPNSYFRGLGLVFLLDVMAMRP